MRDETVSRKAAKAAKNLTRVSLHDRKRLLNDLQNRSESRRDVGAHMQANRSAMTASQRLKIAKRLGLLQHPKRERLIRERHIDSVVRSHLNEHAARRTALVKLPRRVQKPRSVAGCRRDVQRIAKVSPNRLNQSLVLRRFHDVVEHRNVVAGVRSLEVSSNESLN